MTDTERIIAMISDLANNVNTFKLDVETRFHAMELEMSNRTNSMIEFNLEVKSATEQLHTLSECIKKEFLTKDKHEDICKICTTETKEFMYDTFIAVKTFPDEVKKVIECVKENTLKKATSYVSLINGMTSLIGVVIGGYLLKLIGIIK